MRLLVGSLLLLEELGEELLIGDMSILGSSPSILLSFGIQCLSSESLLGDESLDLWRLVESLLDLLLRVLLLDLLLNLSGDNVLSDIVFLSKDESSSDLLGSLGS